MWSYCKVFVHQSILDLLYKFFHELDGKDKLFRKLKSWLAQLTNGRLKIRTKSDVSILRCKTLVDFCQVPSKYLLLFKTSLIRLQRSNFCLSRGLQDVLKTFCKEVLKTSWKNLTRRLEDVLEDEKLLRWRRLEDVLKTGLEDVLKTYLEDVLKTSPRQTKFLLVISVSNKSKCLSNKSLFHKLYLRNLRRIQNASPIISIFVLFWNTPAFLF